MPRIVTGTLSPRIRQMTYGVRHVCSARIWGLVMTGIWL